MTTTDGRSGAGTRPDPEIARTSDRSVPRGPGGGLGAALGPSLREVCLLVGRGGEVLWSDASASPVALPDSRARWEAIWERRVELAEIAHSHPLGPRAFSSEDESTMAALESALGRPLRFSVVAPTGMIERRDGADRLGARAEEPWWADLLRLASGMTADPPDAKDAKLGPPEAAEADDEAAP
jgi:hypothetical protein